MKNIELYIPTTKWDLLRRSAVRVGFCAAPYLLLAFYRDDGFFHGWWFFWCVVAIPGAGLALDVWRLLQTRDADRMEVEPESGGAL